MPIEFTISVLGLVIALCSTAVCIELRGIRRLLEEIRQTINRLKDN